MTAILLDGKKIADEITKNIKQEVDAMAKKPRLAVVLVGDNSASKIYVNNKKKAAEQVGIKSTVLEFGIDITEQELLNKIDINEFKKLAKMNFANIDKIMNINLF